MSATETAMCEIISHEGFQGSDYVGYVVDLWVGDRTDPAVGVSRHFGLFNGEDLENEEGEAIDPDFSKAADRYSEPKPHPVIWQKLEETKVADREAKNAKQQMESMLDEEGGRYDRYSMRTEKTLYQTFIAAIDVLAVDEDNEEAWAAVDAYRNHKAQQYER